MVLTDEVKPQLEGLCRALAEASPMPLAAVDESGYIVRYVNPAFCRLVDRPRAELIGKAFSEVLPAGEECLSLLDRVYRTGLPETYTGREYSASDPALWSYAMWPALSADGRPLGIIIQVTEDTPSHQRLVEMNQALMLGSVRQQELAEIADALNVQLVAETIKRKRTAALVESQKEALELLASGAPLVQVLDFLAKAIESHSRQGTMVAIHLLDELEPRFVLTASPSLPPQYRSFTEGVTVESAIGPCCAAAFRGERVVVPDVGANREFKEFASFILPLGILSACSTPMFSSSGAVLGTVATYYSDVREPSPGDDLLDESIARTAGIIVERKQTEDALRRAMDFDEAVVKNMGEGLYTVDNRGLVTSMNPAAEKLFGWTLKELRGKSMLGVTRDKHPDGSPFAREEGADFQVYRHGKDLVNHEDVFIRKDGTFFDVVYSSSAIREGETISGVVVVFRDVSEGKRAEAAVRESAGRFRFMAESMPQKIFTATPSGERDYFNRQWLDFTGIPVEQLTEWNWTRLIHPHDVEEDLRLWRHSIDTGAPFQFVQRFLRKDGVYRWHLSRAHAMKDASGKISLWIGSNTEIHEQKETEEELRRLNEDLNQFAFAASHDLQEPLRMITSYSQLLIRGYRGQLGGEASVCMDFIAKGTGQMRDLLRDLLAYTGANGDEQQLAGSVDLNEIFDRVKQNLKAAIDESGAVVTSGPLPTIRGQEARMVQLFQNLIGNGIKYRGEPLPRIHVSAEELNGECRYAVADNGMGIDPEYHRKIFGVFKRLHGKSIPGTGIGLAICQRVVERCGGSIWVESQVGQGAKFYFTLPECGRIKWAKVLENGC